MRVVSVLVSMSMLWLGDARACQKSALRISGTAGAEKSQNYEFFGNYLNAYYGDNLNIFCSSNDSTYLRIKRNNERLVRELLEVNMTTLHLSVQPELGVHYYSCTQVETNCKVKLRVQVRPVITIVSPNLHRRFFDNKTQYFVPIAEDYEVVCFGNPELKVSNGTDVETISVNKTTVKSKTLHENEYLARNYYCIHEASKATSVHAEITFDYVPVATNFFCVLDYYLQINCAWSVLSLDTTFTLIWMDESENSMRVYEDFLGSKKTRRCDWNMKVGQQNNLDILDNITLVIQACNRFYCSNQTFIMHRDSIIKTEPPNDFTLLKTTPHSAIVTWKGPVDMYYHTIPVEYKLTYRLPGAKNLSGSSSQISCSQFMRRGECQGEVTLPCPSSLYEVEVYARFTSTPRLNEAYWSDPSRITLRTDSQKSSNVVIDPACHEETEVIENKYVAIHELRKFERSFLKEGSAIQGKVIALRKKVDEIRRLCRELYLEDCENFVLQ